MSEKNAKQKYYLKQLAWKGIPLRKTSSIRPVGVLATPQHPPRFTQLSSLSPSSVSLHFHSLHLQQRYRQLSPFTNVTEPLPIQNTNINTVAHPDERQRIKENPYNKVMRSIDTTYSPLLFTKRGEKRRFNNGGHTCSSETCMCRHSDIHKQIHRYIRKT